MPEKPVLRIDKIQQEQEELREKAIEGIGVAAFRIRDNSARLFMDKSLPAADVRKKYLDVIAALKRIDAEILILPSRTPRSTDYAKKGDLLTGELPVSSDDIKLEEGIQIVRAPEES